MCDRSVEVDYSHVLSSIQNSFVISPEKTRRTRAMEPPSLRSPSKGLLSPKTKRHTESTTQSSQLICSSPASSKRFRGAAVTSTTAVPSREDRSGKVKGRNLLRRFDDAAEKEKKALPETLPRKETKRLKSEDVSEEKEELFSPKYTTGRTSPELLHKHDDSKHGKGKGVGKGRKGSKEEEEDVEEHVPSVGPLVYDFPRPEQYEEMGVEGEDFDPLLFIKTLPPVPFYQRCRPFALPRLVRNCSPYCLVLDLDETLVHCSTEPVPNPDMKFTVRANGIPYDIYVKIRPFFYHFMKKVHKKFEVVVFTASQRVYAERLLDLLDPKRQYIRHRLYRETCVNVNGNYLKDLSILGRDLNKVVIVDNSPQAFGYQPNNGIPIESWFDDEKDVELVKLGNFLMELREVDDVRTVLKKRFHIEDLIREYYG